MKDHGFTHSLQAALRLAVHVVEAQHLRLFLELLLGLHDGGRERRAIVIGL
jgi:hypothetical protein